MLPQGRPARIFLRRAEAGQSQPAGHEGALNETTARALKGAANRVLQVEDDPDHVDLRSLDVEAVLDRFETLYRTGYTSGSMSTYKTRFRQAITMYLAWLDQDPHWKSVVKSRRTAPREDVSAVSVMSGRQRATSEVQPTDAGHRLVTHHLPLRPDLLVRIELPVHLTRTDAERIAAFVRSLAFDDGQAMVQDADSSDVATSSDDAHGGD